MPIFFLHMLNFFFISLRSFLLGKQRRKLIALFAWQIVANFCWMLFIQYLCCFVRLFVHFVCYLPLVSGFISRTSTDMIFTMGHCAGPQVLLLLLMFNCLVGFLTQYTHIFNCRQFSWQTLHKLRDTCQVSGAWCASSFPKSFACQVRFLSLSPAKFVS